MIRALMFTAVAAVASMAASGPALSDEYPSRTITLISPYAAGGPTDAIARPVAEELGKALGQTVVVENHPGAGGMVGTARLANSEADGYTLGVLYSSALAQAPFLALDPLYDPIEDFEHIVRLVYGPLLLVGRQDLPAEDIGELLEKERSELDFTIGTTSSSGVLANELLRSKAGVGFINVPYPGAAQVLTDLLGGRLDLTVLSIGAVRAHIEEGTLRPYAVLSEARSPLLPDVPALAETVPGYEAGGWYELAAPAGTSPEIVNRLAEEVRAIFARGEINEQVERGSGMAPVLDSTPEKQRESLISEVEQWRQVIEEAGIEKQ